MLSSVFHALFLDVLNFDLILKLYSTDPALDLKISFFSTLRVSGKDIFKQAKGGRGKIWSCCKCRTGLSPERVGRGTTQRTFA